MKRVQERQGTTLAQLTTRVDRMDRSTSLVIEYSAAVERIYKTAEDTREFKRVARDSAEALLQELAPKMHLPYPLPACTADQRNADDGNRPEGHVLTAWWAFVPALLVGTRIIMPNRLRLPGTLTPAREIELRVTLSSNWSSGI